MLGVLLAGLALAVGLTGLGDVDLEEPELLASALIHVSNFHHICLVVANASLPCPELRSQLILCPKFPNCFEVNGGSWHGLSVCSNGVSSLLIGISFPPTPLAKPNANPVRSPTSIPSPHPKTPANPPNLETIQGPLSHISAPGKCRPSRLRYREK